MPGTGNLMTFEEVVLDIRPELFQNEGEPVESDLHSELAKIGASRSSVRIINIGDRRGGGISGPFRIVESHATGIGRGHEEAAEGIGSPRPCAPTTAPIVPRIFVEHRGEKPFRHNVAK